MHPLPAKLLVAPLLSTATSTEVFDMTDDTKPSRKFSPDEVKRLAARSHCAAETVKKFPNVSEASRLRIADAARVEGIALPVVRQP